MKVSLFAFAVLLGGLVVSANAQLTLPPNPNQVSKRKLGESGGASTGTATVGVKPAGPKTIVINYVAVSPLRQWTNTEGKQMLARLLAFSAPKEGEDGPVEVIREGKVRFLLTGGKEPIDYPLTNLSQTDQIEIKSIAQAAAGGPPESPTEGEEKSDTKTTGENQTVPKNP
ncbi:MAG: hypothetical protein KDN19_18420 [Verrucomicrobiae bacterium]|nr:hypothetical protein [Verrucomicrobiae bacterium]